MIYSWAVVLVQWLACLPSSPTILVRILMNLTIFSVKFGYEKNKNKQKEAGLAHLKNNLLI